MSRVVVWTPLGGTMANRILGALTAPLKRFATDNSGAFAVTFGLMAIVLIAMGGASVDYARWRTIQNTAQLAADAGSLAAAISSTTDPTRITQIVTSAVEANGRAEDLEIESAVFDPATKRVTVVVASTYPTVFVTLVGVNSLPVRSVSVAERAPPGELEVALVLDNTWSMSALDAPGGTVKLTALKSAANTLVNILFEEADSNVEIALVPYADYVNVGTANRNQPWITVPADTSTTTTTPGTERTCKPVTKTTCTTTYPKQTCTKYVDGVPETYDCTPASTGCTTVNVEPYRETCTGPTAPKTTTSYTVWWGCVASRNSGTLRLNESTPTTKYKGFNSTSRNCLNPIVPLTSDTSTLTTNINGMIVNSGSYKPQTYIPTGMLWGVNVLSPSAPFTEGSAYDPNRLRPRKALVLMTDGDNTLQYRASDGRHVALSGTTAQQATQKTASDTDTASLCTYAKGQGIEVFTVSFGTLTSAADTLLRGCADDEDHYFPAANAAELTEAFQEIGRKLQFVRIVD
jgi:Flp pilus assembly protein TadG